MQTDRLAYDTFEVARLLGLSRNSVYKAVHNGEIPSVRVGGRYLIPRGALEAMLARASVKEVRDEARDA